MSIFKTKKEKQAFRAGVITGVKKSKPVVKPQGPRYIGPSFVNGKFYDTNFKKPVEVSLSDVKKLHKEYDPYNKLTDQQVFDKYLLHMRRKFGTFDKNGKFQGLLCD